jgi:hypothetical protein
MAFKFLLTLLLVTSWWQLIQAKIVHCKNKFPGGDYPRSWVYCTKFGTGVPYEMIVQAKA